MAESHTPSSDPEYGPLYESRRKIHPRIFNGPFRQWKTRILWAIMLAYHILPWLRWDRGDNLPNQAILLDLEGRRGYFLWIEIWPQEVYYLTGVLILAAVGLFAASSIAGRVWCGFACFQTLWTDLFMKVEEFFEGDRNKRLILDRQGWSLSKLFKRAGKHVTWLAIAGFVSLTFLWYFNDAPTLTKLFLTGNLEGWTLVSFLFIGGMTYLMAGFAREQVCFYMCPYGRFQSVMTDEESLLVTYEAWRGEPRAKPGKNRDFSDRGHCVDCSLCVQACPTGIDIRNGSQMECIGCGLCIDACNTMMEKFDLPKNLIAYDSYKNMLAREQGKPKAVHIIRPRTLYYALILMTVAGVLMGSLSLRDRLEVNIIRDRAPLFVTLSSGDIRNGYTYKVLNMDAVPKTFELSVEGMGNVGISQVGNAARDVDQLTLNVGPDQVGTYRIYLKAPRSEVTKASMDISFVLTDQDTGEISRHSTVFRGPQ